MRWVNATTSDQTTSIEQLIQIEKFTNFNYLV